MQAAPGMHIEWIEDEAVVLDPETNRLHYLNPPAALVYALILEYGYSMGIERLNEVEGQEHITEDLPRLLENMVDIGLLIDG